VLLVLRCSLLAHVEEEDLGGLSNSSSLKHKWQYFMYNFWIGCKLTTEIHFVALDLYIFKRLPVVYGIVFYIQLFPFAEFKRR